jgi:TolA-binding protein
VLDRHRDSSYGDDALLLMGRGLVQLGRHADAGAAFRRLLERFPESDLAPRARLDLARSERLLGDYDAARAILGLLTEGEPEGIDPAELLYERGLIDLATGEHDAATAALERLLSEHPEFARERGAALRFADVELAAGRPAAAIEAYSAYSRELSDPTERQTVTLKIARALALSGRDDEAIATYDELLDQAISDSLAAEVFAERGELHARASRWDAAEEEFRRAAELAPGTPAAARATLGRARIEWRVRGRREPALEVLLDAFLHAPTSAWGDTARTAARGLERILHYARIAEGGAVVAGLEDRDLVRSTALYRLAEEILEVEKNPAAAAAVFAEIAREHPDSPWAPSSLLASGLLTRGAATAESEAALRRLIERHPDHPAADSARRALGLPVPDRPAAFYQDPDVLVALAGALPGPEDPMVRIVDQLDRYARTGAGGLGRATATGTAPGAAAAPTTTQEPTPPVPPETPNPDLPPGVIP